MNDSNNKSSLFNFDPSLVALIIWIISINGVSPAGGLLLTIAYIIILKTEKGSPLLRNHVSQALTLSIISTIASFILFIVSRLIFIRMFYFVFSFLNFALGVLIFALALLGALKAYNKKPYSIPVIGAVGDELERTIRP